MWEMHQKAESKGSTNAEEWGLGFPTKVSVKSQCLQVGCADYSNDAAGKRKHQHVHKHLSFNSYHVL